MFVTVYHTMTAFRRASHERVNAFFVDGMYLFKNYFQEQEIFDRLKQYYNNQHYRFEVPADDFDDVRDLLADHGYGLVHVETLSEFVVVVKKYTKHPEDIFKKSVMQRSADGYNCFLMTDQEAVERAIQEEAIGLMETDIKNPF